MIEREKELCLLRGLLKRHRIVGLVGARQVGKTTLARQLVAQWRGQTTFIDLEKPEDLARLADPYLALNPLRGLVVIDEVQRQPELFQVLRVLADRPQAPARFLILGSASPGLLRQGSESLAGRVFYHELGGFILEEVGILNHERLWVRGGTPRAYLARTQLESHEWRQGFIRTFLERDLPLLGFINNSITLRRFWTMLAHYHGQTWNASELARAFGVADTTVRGYLDRLTAAMVIWQLPPWHANIAKRQVKAPKIYLTDSGILHTLLNLRTQDELSAHPKVGASWEGFVLQQLIRHLKVESPECFYWATYAGAELDLLILRGNRKFGFEVKRTSAPQSTPSMYHAREDLHLDRLDVIHAGDHTFPLAKGIRAVAFSRLLEDIKPFR
jgi:uncharacterized protein